MVGYIPASLNAKVNELLISAYTFAKVIVKTSKVVVADMVCGRPSSCCVRLGNSRPPAVGVGAVAAGIRLAGRK